MPLESAIPNTLAGDASPLAPVARLCGGILPSRNRLHHRPGLPEHPPPALSRPPPDGSPASNSESNRQEGQMSIRSCTRESEVKDLLHRGHWPAAAAPDL